MWIIIVIIVLLLLYWYTRPSNTERLTSNKRTVLFYADWCPACQRTKPIWNEVKSKLTNHVFEEINISDKALTDAKEKEYGVSVPTIPTIVIIKNGQSNVYKGPKTVSAITQAIISA